MNIPDEVLEEARRAYYSRVPIMTASDADAARERTAQVVAVWARREALREAADYIRHPKHPGLDHYTLEEVSLVLLSLANS